MVLCIYATSICVILYLQVCVNVQYTGQVLNHFFHDQPTLQVDFCQKKMAAQRRTNAHGSTVVKYIDLHL